MSISCGIDHADASRPTVPDREDAVHGGAVPQEPLLSVIAPCFNEQASIDLLAQRTLATFDRAGIAGELVLVDDGSSDATWERIEAGAAFDGRVRGLRHEKNRGMEQAWQTGLHAARGSLVCLIDADLQNRPEDIQLLYETHRQGSHDIIQAVRRAVTAARQRRLFSSGLNLLLNGLFGTRSRDSKSGFVLCRRDVLETVLQHRYQYRYYQSFIGVAAMSRGFTIGEVDTVFDCRHGGQSFMTRPVLVSARICWELIKFRCELAMEERAPNGRHAVGAQSAAPISAAAMTGRSS